MTYEEIQKLNAEHDAAREEACPRLRAIEERNFQLQETETRVYRLGRALPSLGRMVCEVSVNPINGRMYGVFLQHSPELIQAPIWMALAEVVAMFDGWKAGTIKHLPPSSEWFDAKVWLMNQAMKARP